MKKIFYTILAGAAALAAFSACNPNVLPTFTDDMNFAALNISTLTVDETVGTISIPVTVASVDPVSTSVTYSLKDDSATLGTDYSLVDESGVLAFNGKDRTGYIEIKIIPHVGEYTGDRKFQVTLENATGINVGTDKTCTVTISDLDHPLADVLGTYTVKSTDAFYGPQQHTMHLTKDPKDVTVVWCDYIVPFAANNPTLTLSVYGTVSEDHSTITFPFGQTGSDNGNGVLTFFRCYMGDGKYHVPDGGNLVLTKTAEGVYTTNIGHCFANNYIYYGGFILGEEDGCTTTWTKQQ